MSSTTPQTRETSFGQDYQPTLVDRFGVWLSARRIRKFVPDFTGKVVGDFGCGYHASFVRTVLDESEQVYLADVALALDLRQHLKVKAFEGSLFESLEKIPDQTLDVTMCVSVLEHLWEPEKALKEFYRITKKDGVCLFNVPSWKGKKYLEYSAFKLGLSPKLEMDDHKMYYDVKDFWPLLVRAGFKPSQIQCFTHKFGLNTFAACQV